MKKELLFLSCLLLFPLLMYGQSKFSGGLLFGSDLSFMRIDDSKAPTSSGISEEGTYELGFAFGLFGRYDLSDRLFLRTGFQYEQSGHEQEINGLRFPSDMLNRTESNLENTLLITSIGIPLDIGLRFPIQTEKLNFILGAGGLLNIVIDESSEAIIRHGAIDDEEISDPENTIDASVFSARLFTGIEWWISPKLALGIEPQLKYTPNTFTLFLYESAGSTVIEPGLAFRIRLK